MNMNHASLIFAALFCQISANGLTPIRNHEIQRINDVQQKINSNIAKFKKELEDMKTTIDFDTTSV
jgi:archaellum component FlaC